MVNYKNLSSLTTMNKNLINNQYNHVTNNYQSFDNTKNKGLKSPTDMKVSSGGHLNRSLIHPPNYNKVFDHSWSK